MSRGRPGLDVGVELAALVVSTSSVDELLVEIAEFTARTVPSAASASVALAASAWSGPPIAVDERAARLEAHQRRGVGRAHADQCASTLRGARRDHDAGRA